MILPVPGIDVAMLDDGRVVLTLRSDTGMAIVAQLDPSAARYLARQLYTAAAVVQPVRSPPKGPGGVGSSDGE